jgi:L-ascorbate metabolism protein UlaG (beta-lactamase superfamily)
MDCGKFIDAMQTSLNFLFRSTTPMTTQLTWLGHGSWWIKSAGKNILLDPFLNESPTSPLKSDAVEADYILLSHAHFDHMADVAEIADRTDAFLIANVEVCEWFHKNHGLGHVEQMNQGGSIDLPFGRVTLTIAHHSSQFPDGSYGGNPCGFVVKFAEGSVYFACDTALFSDMKLIAEGVDLAVLPIGDRFTMGPADSVRATKLISPKRVVPAHYDTWPPIHQDTKAWAERIRAETEAEPVVIQPGESITL